MEFTMQLARDLVAILPDSVNKRSKIFVPDWQRSLHGEVLGIGPKVQDLAVGDRVVFGAAKGMEAVYSGAAIRICRFDDIDMALEDDHATNI